MNKKSTFFILASVVLAALVTSTRFFAVFGINLNLVLALLAAWTFLLNGSLLYFLLGPLAALISKSSADFEWASLAFFVLPFVFYGLMLISPFRPIPTVFLLSVIGTFMFYAIIDVNFIISRIGTVALEASSNSFAAIIFYRLIGGKDHESRT